MEQFDLYVHGVPVGHEICGCDEELDYIKGFYNHDVKVEVSSLLQIDIVGGKSFYTYLRKKNVRNAEGRPGSYFGLTVSFSNKYCTNVQMLYEILDAIYKQICVDCLIKSDADTDRFLVKEIGTSRYKGSPTIDYIKAAFKNNIEKLRFDVLKEFVSSKSETKFSLKEVDSPLFRETLKSKRILVSPEYGTASIAYNSLLKELEPIKDENAQLKLANTQLMENNNNLSNEVARLEKELADSAKSASKKYKEQLEKLQTQLNECKQKKEELDARIKEATSAVDLIDKPFKKLTRLLAGRFQKEGEKNGKTLSEISPANRTKHKKAQWVSVGSIILLFAITCLCGYCCYAVSKLSKSVAVIQQEERKGVEQAVTDTAQIKLQQGEQSDIAGETDGASQQPDYDDYQNCEIDISDYSEGKILHKGSFHKLSMKKVTLKNGKKTIIAANVPSGTWESSPGIKINGNTFSVDTVCSEPLNVLIYYTVNNQHVKTRIIQIK